MLLRQGYCEMLDYGRCEASDLLSYEVWPENNRPKVKVYSVFQHYIQYLIVVRRAGEPCVPRRMSWTLANSLSEFDEFELYFFLILLALVKCIFGLYSEPLRANDLIIRFSRRSIDEWYKVLLWCCSMLGIISHTILVLENYLVLYYDWPTVATGGDSEIVFDALSFQGSAYLNLHFTFTLQTR